MNTKKCIDTAPKNNVGEKSNIGKSKSTPPSERSKSKRSRAIESNTSNQQSNDRTKKKSKSTICHLLECAEAAQHTKAVSIQDHISINERKQKKQKKTQIITTSSIDVHSSISTVTYSSKTTKTIHVKPLLVLDLNGILCHRVREIKRMAQLYRPSIGHVANTSIIPRNDIHELLEFLDQYFALAIWTSATKNTAKYLVNLLIPEEIRQKLLFVWNQKKCKAIELNAIHSSSTARITSSSYKKPVFIKSLNKVWETWPLWNSHNTLLIDDSPEKCPTQLRNNYIHPPPLQGVQETIISSDSSSDINCKTYKGDVWNEREQYAFFEKLVTFWKSSTLNNNVTMSSNVEEIRILYWNFLETHATGHMGWRGDLDHRGRKGDI